jgi:hypothetical protein
MKVRKMTPKDFVPHLLIVLADLTKHEPGVSIPMQETYDPVCGRMGISVSDFGKSEHGTEGNKTPWVHRQIGLAFRQIRDNGLGEYAKRGHWALTQAGLDQLTSEKAEVPSAATLAAAKAQARAEDDADDSNVVQLQDDQSEHPYSDDAYIRGLAVERTPCFGAHSVRSDVCKGCLLRDDCVSAVSIRKAQIAADLEREEMVAKKAAEARQKKKDQQNASIDELMAKMDAGTDDDKTFGKMGVYEPSPGELVSSASAHRETICAQCNEQIPENQDCYWVEGEGIFHPECINAPAGA